MTIALFNTLQPLRWWGKEEKKAREKEEVQHPVSKTIAKTKVYYELVTLALTPASTPSFS